MNLSKTQATTILVLLANLIYSSNISYALTSDFNGDIDINRCVENCLRLTSPEQTTMPLNMPQFINNSQEKIFYMYNNYNSQDISQKVSAANSFENSSFTLSVSSTPLINRDNPTSKIPYTLIGIASFNNSADNSIDFTRMSNSTSIESNIDPVFKTRTSVTPIGEPFNQDNLENHINHTDNIENYYTYFSGSGINSDAIEIIPQTPSDNNSIGIFNFGLSAIVKIPSSSIDNGLTDGTYYSTITFTLINA